MPDSAEYGDDDTRPATWPERLRQVADRLDLTDPIVIEYVKAAQEKKGKKAALRATEGKEMQRDLRQLAEDMERHSVRHDAGFVKGFYMVPEWAEGGREKYMVQRERMGLGNDAAHTGRTDGE